MGFASLGEVTECSRVGRGVVLLRWTPGQRSSEVIFLPHLAPKGAPVLYLFLPLSTVRASDPAFHVVGCSVPSQH